MSLAHLHTVPVLYSFDNIRNCFRCRKNLDDHSCRHWEETRKLVRLLHQQARRVCRNVTELQEHTDGQPASLYQYVDGSVAYFAYGAPSWQEAGELTGTAREMALEILYKQGAPVRKTGWSTPSTPGPGQDHVLNSGRTFSVTG